MVEEHATPIETLIAQRREKLKTLAAKGVNPYPYHFEKTHSIAHLAKDFAGPLPEHGSDQTIRTAGRIMTMRDMGKSCFATIADGPHRVQVYVKKDVVGEDAYHLFQKISTSAISSASKAPCSAPAPTS